MMPFYANLHDASSITEVRSYKFSEIHECPMWIEENGLVLLIVECHDGIVVIVKE